MAKAGAQVILISGCDGGTGAAPLSSIHDAGLPWELGLAETHQTLLQNGLRDRVAIETDGKLMTGRDVAIAALLGAEEFGFATAPLVTLGCVMMRVCNLDTCPMGIATQNPELRKRFAGKPEYVENFMRFIAQELREYMAKLGVRTVNEMVGRTDLLCRREGLTGRASRLDLDRILCPAPQNVFFNPAHAYDFHLERTKDEAVLLRDRGLLDTLAGGKKRSFSVAVSNTDRAFGTLLGAEITRRHPDGMADDSITVHCTGAGGQSFGAFIPKGLTLDLCGDANDYLGKGLSGGRLIVRPSADARFVPEKNIIAGNVALYGATSGEAYLNGRRGRALLRAQFRRHRRCRGRRRARLRIHDGRPRVILGPTGKNFAAGMSGGVAYVLDEENTLYRNLNKSMVGMEKVEVKADAEELRALIEVHAKCTGSPKAKRILASFDEYLPKFKKIIPHDYKRQLELAASFESRGLDREQAQIEAFYAGARAR